MLLEEPCNELSSAISESFRMQLSARCPILLRNLIYDDGYGFPRNPHFLYHSCYSFNYFLLILVTHASPNRDLHHRQFCYHLLE